MMIEETRAAARSGIACIVDAGHPDIMRSLGALTRITRESGMPIAASGGFYVQRTYPPDIAARSVEEIANDLVHEAMAQRLGAFGEIGQEAGHMTPDEQKVFKAMHKPIFVSAYLSIPTTHIWADEQLPGSPRRGPPSTRSF